MPQYQLYASGQCQVRLRKIAFFFYEVYVQWKIKKIAGYISLYPLFPKMFDSVVYFIYREMRKAYII